MDFVSWLVTKHLKKDTPVGDLARDIQRDRCLPITARTPEAVLSHIMLRHSACRGAQDAVQQAERRWKASCRREDRAHG
jgi:hypothetical protein